MNAPVVQVREGQLKGFIEKNIDGGQYFAFRKIPYAEPPIGDLRFKDPSPPKPWTGIRDVGNVSPKSLQYDIISGLCSGEEDCLYLNVSTNSLTGKKPVMVFIHGGGFIMGSPGGDLYGPDYLLKHDVVFVGIVYRLGCLGFMNLGIPEAPGNQGLKDQIAALKWIRENIHAFGGDPDNVTIYGQSAGGVIAHLLTLSPLAKGLFHKAIAQSGVCLCPFGFDEKPLDNALRLTELLGKKTDDPREAWKIFMNSTARELIDAQKKMMIGHMDGYDLAFPFVPSIDAASLEPLIPECPSLMAKRGVDVPLLMGYNSDEGILNVLGPRVESDFREMNRNFAKILARDMNFIRTVEPIEEIADTVREFYFGDDAITINEKKYEYSKLKGDVKFINGIQEIAELQMEKSTPTYLYRYSYIANYPTLNKYMKCELKGACHCDEMGALFHGSLMMRNRTHQEGTKDRLIMKRLTKMWTNFAKTGNPTPQLDKDITTEWKPLAKGEKNYLEINTDLIMRVNPDERAWKFWKNILAPL